MMARGKPTRDGEELPPLQPPSSAWLSRLRSGRGDSVRGSRGLDREGADRDLISSSHGPLGPLQKRTLARLRGGGAHDDCVPGHLAMRDADDRDRIPAGPQDSMVSLTRSGSSVQTDFRAVKIGQGGARCDDAAPSGPARPATRGLALAMGGLPGECHKSRPASRRPSTSFVNSDAAPLRDHRQGACSWFEPAARIQKKSADDQSKGTARTGSVEWPSPGTDDQLGPSRGHTRRGQRDSSRVPLSSRGLSAKWPEVDVL